MAIPNRKKFATGEEDLDWLITDDKSRTLFDRRLNETYHSGCGAIAETMVVYLRNSMVWERMANKLPTLVLEFGFGTATGFLLTAALAEASQCELEFFSIEHRLLPITLLRELKLVSAARTYLAESKDDFDWSKLDNGCFLECLASVNERLLEALETADGREKTGILPLKISDHVTLSLWLGDASDFPYEDHLSQFDAIYYDPFAPEVNPELWCKEKFQNAFRITCNEGTLTSYCVKSSVRKAVEAAGYIVQRMPGPVSGKREVLFAVKKS